MLEEPWRICSAPLDLMHFCFRSAEDQERMVGCSYDVANVTIRAA
jgi:hypothetical protein